MDSDVSSKVSTTAIIIYNVELIILIIANISCLLFLSVLKKSRCFHVNLRLLLANFSFTFLLVIISRYLIIVPLWIAYFFNVDVAGITFCRLAKSLHDTAIYVSGLGLAVLVIERTVATVCVRSYESSRHKLLGVFLILLQWIFGAIFVFTSQISHDQFGPLSINSNKLACQIEYTSSSALALSLTTIIGTDFVAIIVFLILLKINKSRYRHVNSFLVHPHLSERYQTAENVRTTRLLCPMVFGYLIASLLAGGIMVYATMNYKNMVIQISTEGKVHNKEIYQSFDVITATYAMVFPYLAMYGHASLVNTMEQIVCRQTKVSPNIPLSLDGRQLVLPVNDETDYHFATLESMWNRAAEQSQSRRDRQMID